MNYLFKYFMGFLVIILIGQVFNKYKYHIGNSSISTNNYLINKYLLNKDNSINNNVDVDIHVDQKTPLWIFVNTKQNSREWESFFSRSNKNVNQPYIQLCINTIVDKCSKSFNIFLITDDSFSDIIDNWKINMDLIPEPIKSNYRNLALCKILYNYGGLIVPSSFLCKKDLYPFYYNNVDSKGIFSCEIKNDIIYSDFKHSTLSYKFLGANENNDTLLKIIKDLEIITSTEFNDENRFMGKSDDIIKNEALNKNLTPVNGKFIGTKDKNNKIVTLDNLLSDKRIEFSDELVGIYIPEDEVLTRPKYQWFSRIPLNEILEGNLAISKEILLSCK